MLHNLFTLTIYLVSIIPLTKLIVVASMNRTKKNIGGSKNRVSHYNIRTQLMGVQETDASFENFLMMVHQDQ